MSDEKNNDNGIIGGIILIVIGLVALLKTLFDIDIVWTELAKLWPVFLVIFGVSLLPLHKIIKAILVMIALLASFCIYYYNVEANSDDDAFYYDITADENMNIQEFSEPFDFGTKTASVTIDYGAGDLILLPPVSHLVKATNLSDYIVQDLSVIYDDNHADIEFGVNDNDEDINIDGEDFESSRFNIALNKRPVYDFEVNVGACDLNFDFTPYKLSRLEINGGACDIDVKLGSLCDDAKIVVETGVSDIRIGVPASSGCKVECNSLLTIKDFKGFTKTSSTIYETPNYSSADKNIDIEFDGAISNFEIYRY